MANDAFASNTWQARPVFISSTFKDMQAERDYLRHVVFPRLEEELRKGRLLMEPIDLRQGVETVDLESEEKREQRVLKVCLEEIQRSRPFLIVLLGDRYGWVPPEERMTAATQEVGFDADVRDKSVTALEIEFGILKERPDQRQRSFFYFRDPLPYSQMPEAIRANFSDEFSADEQTRARHSRLAELKRSLVNDPELAPRVHIYRAGWDALQNEVTGLQAWGEQVYQNLLQELQADVAIAASQPPQSWEEQERTALAEFIAHRRRDFIGRAQLLDDLTDLARSEVLSSEVPAIASGITWGACVTGEPGSGKSAIFAELAARLSQDETILLLTNAAGATPRGSQVEAMLERFIEELADALGIVNPLPAVAAADEVDATFAALLGRVAVKRRVVVLIDALNQFDATPRAQHLTWLRAKLWPANARLLATGLAGVTTESLSQWAGIEELEIPPLRISDDDTDDVTAIARTVWRRYHRQMNPDVLRVLKEKRLPDGSFAAGNPLWLVLALEQINLLDADDFARAERDFAGSPAERQRAMLIDTADRMPPTVAALYDMLLAQTERIFGDAPTRAFGAVITVSRFGWRESDLLALIPTAARVLCPGQPVPELDDLRLAALRRSFRAHLVRRGALEQLDFFHAQLRQAVERRVLNDSNQRQVLHRTIADHLESLPPGDSLRDSELMVHLIAGDDRQRAARVYAGLPDSSLALTAATQALVQHVVVGATDQPNPSAIWGSTLLTQRGLTSQQVAKLCNRFNFDLHDALANSADLATRQLLLQAAQNALQRLAESDPTNADWQRDLSVSLEKLGDLAMAQGNLPETRRLFDRSLSIRECLANTDPDDIVSQRNFGVSLLKMGDLVTSQGNVEEAEKYFDHALGVFYRLNLTIAQSNRINPISFRDISATCLKLGDLANSRGELNVAQEKFTSAIEFAKLDIAAGGEAESQRNLSLSLERLGNIAFSLGNLADARNLFTECLVVRESLFGSDPTNRILQRDLSITCNKLGDLALAMGDNSEAQLRFIECLQIRKQLAAADPENLEWQRNLSVSLNKLGDLATALEDLAEAWRCYTNANAIAKFLAGSDPENAEWQRDLVVSHYKLALSAQRSGDDLNFTENLLNCLFTLRSMLQRGLNLDAKLAQLHRTLDSRFGAGQ